VIDLSDPEEVEADKIRAGRNVKGRVEAEGAVMEGESDKQKREGEDERLSELNRRCDGTVARLSLLDEESRRG